MKAMLPWSCVKATAAFLHPAVLGVGFRSCTNPEHPEQAWCGYGGGLMVWGRDAPFKCNRSRRMP